MSWWMRIGNAALNVAGDAVELLGWQLARLQPADLLDRARARTGLDDFGAWEYPDALAIACGSLSSDANLSLTGRIALREHLTLALETRLQRIELERRRPEIFEAPLNAPLIILGLPRSGTTFLHRLLVDLPGHRGLATWEIRRPLPPTLGPDRRRREARLALAVLRGLAPGIDAKHALDADAAEECVGLFDSCLWTPTLWRLAAARSYLAWYLIQDPTQGYRVYRKLLQVFQDRDPTARLVLKLPNHIGFIGPLLQAIPEARIVQTHRDPVPVIASYCSLMNSVHAVGSRRIDATTSGRQALEMWGTLSDRGLSDREALPPGRVLDVDYRALVSDPEAAVRSIHAHFELPYGEAAQSQIEQMVASRPQHHRGKHAYALEDVGLQSAQVAARFDRYTHRYLAR